MKLSFLLPIIFYLSCGYKQNSKATTHNGTVTINDSTAIIKNEIIHRKESNLIQIKMYFTRPYCFGAYKSEKELNEFKRPRVFSNSEFRVYNNKTDKVYVIKSDKNGIINDTLPYGSYSLKLGLSKNKALELPYFESCDLVLNKNWFTFTNTGKPILRKYTFDFTCGNPCAPDDKSKSKP